jgi:phospholipid transport system transporter-binding protein
MSRQRRSDTRVTREDDALVFTGALVRDAVAPLWSQALAAAADDAAAERYDLRAVTRVDSAGLALLVELAARGLGGSGALELVGSPEGLQELRAAYRLDTALRPAG